MIARSSQAALQWSRSPVSTRFKHADGLAGHDVGQGTGLVGPKSQVSPSSRTPLPHLAGQSLSRFRLLPEGQQPSPGVNDLMGA